MPSKHKKKKSKDRNSAPQKAPVRKTLQDLDREAKELSQEWKISPQKRSLDEQVRHLLLTQRNISIDNALCLGLGSIEMAPHWSLPGRTKANQRVKDSMPVDWQDSIDPDDAPSTFPPVADGRKRNISLYQLLVFETVLSCLREKFTISSVRFQDPRFTKTDQEFLKQRGHIVLDWDTTIPEVGGGYKMDPRLSDIISRSTMCYLPYLDSPTIVEVICAAKPSLYLGSELISNVIRRFFHAMDRTKDLMGAYTDIVLSYDFASVVAFGDAEEREFGFMWPADLTDQEVVARVEARNSEIIEAELEVLEQFDKSRAERKAEKEG